MDEAEFDRLVANEKARQKPFCQVYESPDPERQQGPWLRNKIAESESSRDTWDALNRMVQHYLRERRTLPKDLGDWAADALDSMMTNPAKRPRPRKSEQDAANRRVEIYLGTT